MIMWPCLLTKTSYRISVSEKHFETQLHRRPGMYVGLKTLNQSSWLKALHTAATWMSGKPAKVSAFSSDDGSNRLSQNCLEQFEYELLVMHMHLTSIMESVHVINVIAHVI
ncbi:hypothetical protein AVEN_158107-1 [Araneus ventricosus]|uniref:Uncharacterized protein n=1 Tax=Araneus ventricosus TaxID=182803 RepID=A0A4Y2GQY1_ARAVE|nr:hypothetical protein AVEN_158107-1 [Araneus ventricosus]